MNTINYKCLGLDLSWAVLGNKVNYRNGAIRSRVYGDGLF